MATGDDDAKKTASVPSSVWGRASRLLVSGAKIAGAEVKGRIAASVRDVPKAQALAQKIQQSRELVTTLSELKGAAMKAGQMLALEFGDMMPPEVVEILRELHDGGTFMPFDQVRYILGRELGRDKLAELEDLTPEPIAAASIGQVHKATLRGHPVAVKVQFPGVAKSIDTDLAVLRRLVGVFLTAQGKAIDIEATFDELARGFKQEADYRQEAACLERYASVVTNPAFVVPRVHREFSSERVLTMSFERGERLGAWLKSRPDRAAAQRFAALVVELTVEEFFANGLVQTDPNYGNFLYRADDNRLVLLDFGATREYPPSFRRDVRDLLFATVAGDDAKILAFTFDHGMLDRRESKEVVDLYLAMMRRLAEMFLPANQPFRCDDDRYVRALREDVMRFAASVRHSAPARQLIFLNRKLGGMFHLLKDVGAAIDLASYLEGLRGMAIRESGIESGRAGSPR